MAKRSRAKPRPQVGTDEVDLAIVQLIEADPLITNAEIGRKMPMDVDAVSKRRNRPSFRALYAERNPPANQILQAYRATAARVYVGMLEPKTPPAVRERVARVISGADQKPVKVNVSGEVKGDVRLGLDEETKARIRARYGFADAPTGGDRKRPRNPGNRTRAA